MTVRRYAVRRISTYSLARFGCVLGGVAMLLPGLLCGLLSWQLISILNGVLEVWRAAAVDLLGIGAPVEFDFIDLLGLESLYTLLTRLNDQRFVVALLVLLGVVFGGGLLMGLIILLVGWAYNLLAALSGGLELELRAAESNRDSEPGHRR